MNNILSWNEFFLAIAKVCALRSKDPNTKVGSCIVDDNNRIISTGYNGLPIGLDDNKYPWDNRDGKLAATKYPYVIHAETNAILFAKKNLTNCILYTTLFPCSFCTKLIIQSQIKIIYFISDKYDNCEDNIAAKKMLKDAKIKWIQLNDISVTVNKK